MYIKYKLEPQESHWYSSENWRTHGVSHNLRSGKHVCPSSRTQEESVFSLSLPFYFNQTPLN